MDPRAARFDPPTEPHVTTSRPRQDPARDPVGVTFATGDPDAFVLGVPFDGTSGRRPMQRHGPELLRALWTGADPGPDPVRVHDVGDVRTPDLDAATMCRRTREAVEAIREAHPDALPVVLGGEHTVSLPAVRALEPASIVSLDAHTDLWRETNGEQLAHSTWLYRAREELACEVALPLTRTTRGEAEQIVEADDVHLELPERLPEPVYLTIDVDVFDPEDAPAVAFPERGGPAPERVLETVRDLASRYEVCGVDVVEVNANRVGPTARWAACALATALTASTAP